MRYSSTTSMVLALCAINEAFGGPTHNHLHQKFHQKRELKNVNWNALDWDGMGIDWAKAYSQGHSTTTPTPNVASVPEATSSQSTDVAVKAESAPIIQSSSTLNTPSVIDAQEVPNQDSELTDDPNDGDKSKPHDHDSPDKKKPDHDSPDKKKPDHDSPDKKKPDHDSPDKKKPDHDSPDKKKPDHDSPDKKKPDHDSPDKKKPDSPKHDSSAKLWKNLVGASNNRKVFGMSTPTYGKEVGYLSNVGIPEGSNMIKVESADDHTFTNQFINISEEPMTVVIWNKAASPGLQDPMNANPNLGASIAPEHPALTLALQPNESQTVAFLDESVIGWAQACETRAVSGGFQTTWGEAQFNSTGSGYDVSAIQNAQGSNYIMHITSVEASSCESTESKNMWITDTSTVGSGSCYIAQNTAHLITKMGGYAS